MFDFGITCDAASADGRMLMAAIQAELAELRASVLSDTGKGRRAGDMTGQRTPDVLVLGVGGLVGEA